MDDNEHILTWWAEKGHESLPVEWEEGNGRFRLGLNRWNVGDQPLALYRYQGCEKWSQTSTTHGHQAACLIRHALWVGLIAAGAWIAQNPHHTSVAGPADTVVEREDDKALTAAWDAWDEIKEKP